MRGDVGIGVRGDWDWVHGVAVVIVGRLPEADAVESAVDIVFVRKRHPRMERKRTFRKFRLERKRDVV